MHRDLQAKHIKEPVKFIETNIGFLAFNPVDLLPAQPSPLGEILLRQAKFPSPGGKQRANDVRIHAYIVRKMAYYVKQITTFRMTPQVLLHTKREPATQVVGDDAIRHAPTHRLDI
ncbi:MAG: hypothetical protein A3H35_13225 [Betaproteobacteria bacterium RIFCSPLOWO2_02_FULL_62_17]|nr:MAG: hypothetical protein A3H35_13225 [Betaproteobacteria bacterium RIFCSPLOWO2_02_FULL_62_17]